MPYPHLSRCRFLSDSEETLEEELNPEVGHSRPEEHGALLASENAFHV